MNLVEILADNTPREGSETFTVQLTSASFDSSTILSVSSTVLTYTIEDASGMSFNTKLLITNNAGDSLILSVCNAFPLADVWLPTHNRISLNGHFIGLHPLWRG